MPRTFILGNGPSLKNSLLDKLSNDVTFAMNRINLIYGDYAKWRPTFYFAFDYWGEEMLSDVLANIDVAKHSFIRADRAKEIELARKCVDYPAKITYFWDCRQHAGLSFAAAERDVDAAKRMPTAWHLPITCGFGSTLNVCVQVAVMMGYNPIYLLGCDLGHKQYEKGRDLDPNHFDPHYDGHDDEMWLLRDETLLYMHEIIADETSRRGVEVINLTPNDRLDGIYPHKTLEEII